MRSKRIFLLLFTITFLFPWLKAQEETKFKVSPSGRVLIDGAVYSSSPKELFKGGMAIPEARLGVKMSYGKWYSWIDVGFAYGKIGLRNMWIEYSFNPHNKIRFGNFLQPFGYESQTTYSFKSTFEIPLAAALFTPGLQLGGMYSFMNPSFYLTGAFHVESSSLTNVVNYPLFNQQGIGVLTRLVWRSKYSGEANRPIIQAGISGGYASPQRNLVDNYDEHDAFLISANFPTKVTTLQAVGATVSNARNLFKMSPELLLAYRKVALESQYFLQSINRKGNLSNYTTQGFYATVRTILFGDDYTYDGGAAHLGNPKKNTLELVADYNYATLSDSKSGIFGGRANSFNFTLNYYFNPYITARLNYSFTHTWDRAGYEPITMNAFQARLMVLF